MEDTVKKMCGRCGQAVDRAKDSWKQVGDQVVHAVCPTGEALRTLPHLIAAPSPQRRFLTIEEAAELLRVSDRTIRRRIQSGDLPAKRLKGGQTVLIEETDVLGLLEDAREPV